MAELKVKSMFEPCLGTKFEMLLGDGESLEVELKEVDDVPVATANPKYNLRQDPFALLFEGPEDRMVDQGTYRFRHPTLGEHEIFVVPVGPGQYEAVFN